MFKKPMTYAVRTILAVMFLASTLTHDAESQARTVILVRHAETAPAEPGDRDPPLSEAGEARAERLANMLADANITAIYSTTFQRTQRTAAPLASRLGVEVTSVEPTRTHIDDMVQLLQARQPGDIVLVVGHSNTVPDIINGLAAGGGALEQLDEDEHDALFIVTLPTSPDERGTVVLLRY